MERGGFRVKNILKHKLKNLSILSYLLILIFLLSACTNSNASLNNVDALDESLQAVVTNEEPSTPSPAAPNVAIVPKVAAAADMPQNITGTLEIAYLDVGQADSIYITLPNGETMLIDAGEASASGDIIKTINDNNSKGVIDYVITTHPHEDHVGGMAAVIKAFKVKNLWMPNKIHTTKTFENLLDTIEEKDLSIHTAKAGKILFDYGNLKAAFIAPNGNEYDSLNDYSASILLTYNDRRFLFMGDAEAKSESEILASGVQITADVLKVGHHGSNTSSTKTFIQKVAPKYAIISCGKGNSYGHPTAKTLATLSEFGIDIKRTDESGTIICFCDGDKISFTSYQTEIQPRAPTATQAVSPTATPKPDVSSVSTQKQSVTVYATNTGKKYHADGCRYLSKSKIPMDLEIAKQKYGPCSVCHPPQ